MSSYPILVRDGIMARIKNLPYFREGDFKFSTNKSMQIQPQSIPFCGVYFLSETTSPDGDANVGEPRFRSMARFGFSVIVQNNKADFAEQELDKAWDAIASLFTDSTLYNNNTFKIQAYTNGVRTHQFGSVGAENEMPIAELRYDLTCDLGTITYPPVVTDDFETLHVETGYPLGGTEAERAKVQQVKVEWDIPQN